MDSICRIGGGESDFLEIYFMFGGFCAKYGRLEEAERMYKHMLLGYEKATGTHHKSTLDTVNILGLVHVNQGRLAEAARMYERALAGIEEALRTDHPSILNTVNDLEFLYTDQSHLAAERMYEKTRR